MKKNLIKKIFVLLLSVLVSISMWSCSQKEQDSDEDDDTSQSKRTSTSAKDNNFERLVINDFEISEDRYSIKKQGRNESIYVSSEIFEYAFKVPYLPNGYPDLYRQGDTIEIIWSDGDEPLITVLLTVGSSTAIINGSDEPVKMDGSPFEKGEYVFIPIDLFVALLELDSTYDREFETLFIHNKEDFPEDLLLGRWSTIDTFLLGYEDLTTGLVELPSFAESYYFKKDGTYKMVMVSVGGYNDALIYNSGKYKILGNTVICYDVKETLYQGNPFTLSYENKKQEKPHYKFIENYDPDEDAIELGGFWLNRVE